MQRVCRSTLTTEIEYSPQELEFLQAIDQYKRDNRRPYLQWSEVLSIFLSLGYRQVAEKEPLPIFRVGKLFDDERR